MKFDNWKPHCHYLGDLCTPPKGESNLQKFDTVNDNYKKAFREFRDMEDEHSAAGIKLFDKMMKLKSERDELDKIKQIPNLSVGCKTKLRQIYLSETTGRKKVIKNKYLEKGLMVEEDCITQYSLLTGCFHKKNTETKENDYIIGTSDFFWEDIVIDTKASWDIWTFYDSKGKKIKPLYHWQLDGYMWLYGKYFGRLVYCLINTPEHLIKAEERKVMYEMFGNEGNMLLADDLMKSVYQDECKQIRKNHIFDDIELKDKVKVFEIERDEDRIDRIITVVEGCRWYLNNLNEIEDDNI